MGLEYARQLNERGEHVIATCRASSTELTAIGVRVEKDVDVTSQQSIMVLKKKLEPTLIDVLILNAGISSFDSLVDFDYETILHQFKVNTLGPLSIVYELLDNLNEGSKVIFMTSRMASINNNVSGGYYGYRMSKVALGMAAKSLAIDLKEKGIIVALLNPGLVKTGFMDSSQKGVDAKEAVTTLIKRIDNISMQDSGSFFHIDGSIIPW